MTKIIDHIKFYGAMGSQVQLHTTFYDEVGNRERIMGYMPIRAHREAFQKLIEAQRPGIANDRKVFYLTGSFGTGKSHLCLMLANYFAHPLDTPELQGFLKNWSERDPDGAQRARNLRGEGRYLVAVADFDTNLPFQDMVLDAIEEALETDGQTEMTLSTLHAAALDWIVERQAMKERGESEGDILDLIVQCLDGGGSEQRLEEIKQGLAQHHSQDLNAFQKAYYQVTGQRLTIHVASLADSVRELMRTTEFRERYRGLVILLDEFGYALQEGKVEESAFQGFAEMAAEGVDGLPVIFVGVAHRAIEAYATGSTMQDYRKLRDRVTPVNLEAEELEEIIAALVKPSDDLLKEVHGKSQFVQMANSARKAGLVSYLDENQLMEKIVYGIYPMHPFAVYCLTQLSMELGSANRSVFKFFRRNSESIAPYSYEWFASQNDIERSDHSYSIYTIDLLAGYFKDDIYDTSLTARDEVVETIRNYKAAIEEAQRYANQEISREINPDTRRVLDAMLVVSLSKLPVTAANVLIGLGITTPQQKSVIEHQLSYMIESRIIYQGKSSEYEFRHSNMADIPDLLAHRRRRFDATMVDTAEQMPAIGKQRFQPFCDSSGHNAGYSSDKRLRQIFATPTSMNKKYRTPDGREISFWEKLEADRLAVKEWTDKYEGVMVYVLCETDEDIANAKQIVKSNNQKTIIVGIPQSPIPVREKIIDVLNIQGFKDEPEHERLSNLEKAIVQDLLGTENSGRGAIGEVVAAGRQYLEGKNLVWYEETGRVLISNPKAAYETADALMTQLYVKHNTPEHSTLNKAHAKFSGSKDGALRDAVQAVIAVAQPIRIDNHPAEGSGQGRYLRNFLKNSGIIVASADFKGSYAEYQLTSNIDAFRKQFPALAELVDRLRRLPRGEKLPIAAELAQYSQPPYGLSPIAMALFFAVAIRYMGEELRIKLNPAGLGYANLGDPELVIDIATGKYPNATLEREPVTAAVQKMTNGIYGLFSVTPLPAGENCFLADAWQAVLGWWQQRGRLEKTPKIYAEGSTGALLTQTLIVLEKDTTASQLFLHEICGVYGYAKDAELIETQVDELLKRLEEDKKRIESRVSAIKDAIIRRIGALFAPSGETYLDFTEGIRTWFEGLSSYQKDKHTAGHSAQSQTLLDAIAQMTDINHTLLEVLPAAPAYGFGKVDDWGFDRTEDYISKVENAVKTINGILPAVEMPTYTVDVVSTSKLPSEPFYPFLGKCQLVVTAPPEVTVRVAEGSNARDAKEFQVVNGGDTWTMEITKSCNISIIGLNAQGEFSRGIKLTFHNSEDDYRPTILGHPSLSPGDDFYKFRNPVIPGQVKAFLRNIITHVRQQKSVSTKELKEIIEGIIAELSDDSGEQ